MGFVYLDDEISLAHEDRSKVNFAYKRLAFDGTKLTCSDVTSLGGASYSAPNTVERIEIAGQSKAPTKVTITASGQTAELQFFHDNDNAILTIKKPDCFMTDDWVVELL